MQGFPPGFVLGEMDDAAYLARAGHAHAQYLTQACASLGALPSNVLGGAYYFAYSDGVGAPTEQGLSAFGLRDPQDTARPAWSAMQQVWRKPTESSRLRSCPSAGARSHQG